jgi:outer membrane protein OmpA-like peptidoglycan-associated protein
MIRWPKRLVSLTLAALFLGSGCAYHPVAPPARLVEGAAIGTLVGAGIGCGIAASIDDDDPTSYAIGCPTGAVVGALAGAVIAEKTYRPPPPPPVVQRPVEVPPPPPPPAPKPRQRLVLRGVHFDFNKSNIRPEDEPVLDEAVRTLKEESDVRLYVDGYCDVIGGDEYNQALSERRAQSVVTYMEKAGITPGRLTPRGFGKTHFVADNSTDQGRAQNRRVELVPIE